ncbi:hypothetical protein EDEG_02212 [Edhazardia aedis USNM 41457]|uniref:MBOAT family protein n=1 Tax=Edhazardia aedis (strain USNM 41457) TaxID=1003232 RepID=J9DQ12_EDHAE|nr:hypothetical protein EDEG_02212 [Edhazardia aedis USNM 41457]|eukprot:EJW03447.2 hypothetical protein EDEG_02212 [Edhazardia aedis USNM 41457]
MIKYKKKFYHPSQMNISNREKSYLLSLFTIYASSHITRKYHLLNIPLSILVLFIVYTVKDVLLFLRIISTNLAVLYFLNKFGSKSVRNKLQYILMFLTFFFLLRFKWYSKELNLDIGGAIMVLCIKVYYLGKHPNARFLDALCYIFLIPGILSGPVMSYKAYLQYKNHINQKNTSNKQNQKSTNDTTANNIINQRNTNNVNNTNDTTNTLNLTKITNTSINVYKTTVESLIYMAVYAICKSKFPLEQIGKQDSLLKKMLYFIVAVNTQKLKYYFVWKFAESCYEVIGFKNMININPLKVEFAGSVKEITENWNIYTNTWLKESIFVPLKHRGYYLASLATFTVSALWHGTYLGYFLMFITFSLCVPILNNNNLLIKKYFGPASRVISIMQMSLFVSYFSVPFFVHDLGRVSLIWQEFYYFGHHFLFLSTLALLLFKQKRNDSDSSNSSKKSVDIPNISN